MKLPEWRVEPGLLPYPQAVATMEARAESIRSGAASELIWLVEHPPLYTAGTSATAAELLAPDRFPVFTTGRGGRHTYHGPGQRVVYVLLDLDQRGRDIRCFVAMLEGWIVDALARMDVAAYIIPGKIGVWTDTPRGPAKIAAIGIRLRRWVSYHGLSINVAPDLSHFNGIVPCGLPDPVTSLKALGKNALLADIDTALSETMSGALRKLHVGA